VIILSGVLVVLAIALLVTGIVTGNTGHEVLGLDGLKLIYISIGVSIISALCLAIGVFLRRKELFGSAESPASARKSTASRSAKAARTAKTKARVGADDDTAAMVTPAATAAEVPAETSVFVVPGRKRYHLETCRQLAGRDKEELTFVEAREEGFTACTACLPDTALAARAALTETETAATARTETLVPDDEDPASVTRTDLPVTKIDPDPAPDLPTTDEADEDTGPATREIPAAESPAADETTEAPEPEEAAGDTAQLDEAGDAEERPLARSRSLFEPLDRDDEPSEPEPDTVESETVESAEPADTAVRDEDDEADAAAEPEEPEAADDAAAEPEDHVAEATEAEEEPEAAPADEAEDDSEDDSEEDAAPAGEASETPGDDADARPADADLPYVRILSGTKRYHRPDCALIEDIAEDADDLETLSTDEAKERGCTPCLVCQPDKRASERP
jgi:hypothetical protein